MAIAKTLSRSQYTGDGTTLAFSFPYRFFAATDLEVYVTTAAGVETLQTLTTHYTVSNTGTEDGGTVTFLTAPVSGVTVTILRVLPLTQAVDYQANDTFPAETHEGALDRLTLQAQQISERQGRALIAPLADTANLELPLDRASKFLFFDESKNPTAAAGVSDVAVSAFMATPVAATGAEDFQQKVGIDDGIFFAPRTGVTYDEGLLYYDDVKKALTFYNDEADAALNIGQEVWAHVRNATGSTITNGQVVYINGATGHKPTIALADADTEVTSRPIGLATHDIENNSDGFVTIAGEVGGLNTSAFSEGDLLYLSSTAGGLTTTKPGDGKYNRIVGVVAKAHATNGSIFVHAMSEGLTLAQSVWDAGTATDEALISPAKLAKSLGIVQRVTASTTVFNTLSGLIPIDDTKPQSTEGEEIFTLAITPTNASNIIRVEGVVHMGHSLSGALGTIAIFKDSETDPIDGGVFFADLRTINICSPVPVFLEFAAGGTSEITLRMRAGTTSNTGYLNGSGGARKGGGALTTWLTATEVKA